MKQLMYIDALRKGWRKCPPSLQVAMTDHCFNTCPMCGHWKRICKHEMPVEIWGDKLVELQGLGLESVCYSGGDPFKHPDINHIMMDHDSLNLPFAIITSGYIPDNVNLDLVAQAKWVRVSLDSLSDVVYKKCRGGVITPEMILKSLNKAREAGVNIQFNLTAHNLNLDGLSDVFDLARALASKVAIKPVIHDLALSLDEDQTIFLKKLIEDYRLKFDESGIEHDLTYAAPNRDFRINRCYACMWQLFIDANGEVNPCCIIAGDTESQGHMDSLGNILKEPWENVWNRVLAFSEVRSVPPEYCQNNCIARHYLINRVVEPLWDHPSFF